MSELVRKLESAELKAHRKQLIDALKTIETQAQHIKELEAFVKGIYFTHPHLVPPWLRRSLQLNRGRND